MVAAIIDARLSSLRSLDSFKDGYPLGAPVMESGDGGNLPGSDKKRNKLGYHRTAVACGHCRRRKIRCIQADSSSQRCQNCIRLKKDCQFFPVDQTAQTGAKPRKDGRGDGLRTESEASVSSSSPGLQAGSMDPYDPFRPTLESPTLTRGGGSYPLSSPTNMPNANGEYDYSQQFHPTQWSQPGSTASRYYGDNRPTDDAQGHNYWPPSEQPGQPPYVSSGYAMSSGASAAGLTSTDQSFHAFTAASPDYQYPPPQTGRDEGMQTGRPIPAYGLYRPGTGADGRELHATMGIPQQTIMSAPFTAGNQHAQFSSTPGGPPRWAGSGQINPAYAQHDASAQWYGQATTGREESGGPTHVLASQHASRGQFRSNPG